jgi:hypothetical protein
MRTTTIVLGALGALTTLARADDGGDDAPTRELGTVTVTATRPTSLPSHPHARNRSGVPSAGSAGDQSRPVGQPYLRAVAHAGEHELPRKRWQVAAARCRIDDRWSASLGIDNLGNEEYWAFHPYTQRTFAAELAASF